MSGGPYGPGGVLSDFGGGGEGGVPKVYSRRDPNFDLQQIFHVSHEVKYIANIWY